jgi:hypothetical protein
MKKETGRLTKFIYHVHLPGAETKVILGKAASEVGLG